MYLYIYKVNAYIYIFIFSRTKQYEYVCDVSYILFLNCGVLTVSLIRIKTAKMFYVPFIDLRISFFIYTSFFKLKCIRLQF